MGERLLTFEEAAAKLDLLECDVVRMVEEGVLAASSAKGEPIAWLFQEDEVECFNQYDNYIRGGEEEERDGYSVISLSCWPKSDLEELMRISLGK